MFELFVHNIHCDFKAETEFGCRRSCPHDSVLSFKCLNSHLPSNIISSSLEYVLRIIINYPFSSKRGFGLILPIRAPLSTLTIKNKRKGLLARLKLVLEVSLVSFEMSLFYYFLNLDWHIDKGPIFTSDIFIVYHKYF